MTVGRLSTVQSAVAENGPTRAFLADERGTGRSVDPAQPGFERFRAWFTRPLLSRPVILDAEQTRQLGHDLPALLRILHTVPARLFSGDQEAMARFVGWTQPSLGRVLRRLSGPPVALARADLVHSPSGFKVVELNTSSSLGSFEFGELCRAVLSDPAFRRYARRSRLYYLDPLRLMADTLLGRMGRSLTDRPSIALVKWTRSPVNVDPSLFIDLMADLGFRVVTCTVGDLTYRRDGLYAGATRVDLVYRAFLLKTVADDPDASETLAPLSDAVADGAVHLFCPLNADLFGAKACLALLSDVRNRSAFDREELAVLDRVLPWTRLLRDVDPSYLREHREELVLKPSIGHAGRGVVGGWLVSPQQWQSLVDSAPGSDYVVQQRVRSVAERFYDPAGAGAPSVCLLHWGMFVTNAGLSGGFVKGLPGHEQDTRYLGDGSSVGCVFHAPHPTIAARVD